MKKNIQYFHKFWNTQTDGRISPYRDYHHEMNELLFFLEKDKKYNCLELGCGNGELYGLTKHLYENYTGVDFSESNIEIFKKKYPTANIISKDVLEISNDSTYNLIHSNGLLQYLTLKQIEELIINSLDQCEDNGFILHRGIPDKRMQFLYLTGYLKPGEEVIRLQKILNPVLYKFYAFSSRIFQGGDRFGFWYKTDDIIRVCKKLKVNYTIFGSIIYRYRFTLLIKK
jgi:cyclopropane fatty-acyl-phospholipid synthase-like methyltransferase